MDGVAATTGAEDGGGAWCARCDGIGRQAASCHVDLHEARATRVAGRVANRHSFTAKIASIWLAADAAPLRDQDLALGNSCDAAGQADISKVQAQARASADIDKTVGARPVYPKVTDQAADVSRLDLRVVATAVATERQRAVGLAVVGDPPVLPARPAGVARRAAVQHQEHVVEPNYTRHQAASACDSSGTLS
jgi:hypothetical protein